MAFNKPKTKGLAGAEAMIKELEWLTNANIGADYVADQARYAKPDKNGNTPKNVPTHTEVMEFLALGGRSLYPSEEDSKQGSKLVRDAIAKHLKRTGEVVKDRKGVERVLSKERQAKAGANEGLLKCGKYLGKKMAERMKAKSTTSGAPAEQVGKDYARQRSNDWQVANSRALVYVASGQLANAVASGKVKVYFVKANVGSLLSNT